MTSDSKPLEQELEEYSNQEVPVICPPCATAGDISTYAVQAINDEAIDKAEASRALARIHELHDQCRSCDCAHGVNAVILTFADVSTL